MNFKGKSIKHWLFITSWALVLYFETLYSTEMIKEIFNVYISHVWGVLIVTVGLISPMHSGVWDVKASELSWKNALFPVAVVIAVILLIFAYILLGLSASGPWWLILVTTISFIAACLLLMTAEIAMLSRKASLPQNGITRN